MQEPGNVNSAWENPRRVSWLTLHGELSVSPKQLWKKDLVNSKSWPRSTQAERCSIRQGQMPQVLSRDLTNVFQESSLTRLKAYSQNANSLLEKVHVRWIIAKEI